MSTIFKYGSLYRQTINLTKQFIHCLRGKDEKTKCTNCKELQIWDVATGEVLYSIYPIEDDFSWPFYTDTSGQIFRETLSPDGKYFISEGSLISNSSNGNFVKRLIGNYKDWSADNRYI